MPKPQELTQVLVGADAHVDLRGRLNSFTKHPRSDLLIQGQIETAIYVIWHASRILGDQRHRLCSQCNSLRGRILEKSTDPPFHGVAGAEVDATLISVTARSRSPVRIL
jgi:hypothetical protein